MNFSSLKEYFYKLYNAAMKRMLLPLACFLGIYYAFFLGAISPFVEDETVTNVMLIAMASIIVIVLTIVHLAARKIYRANIDLVGLGNKLDVFAVVTRKKLNAGMTVSLLAAAGFLVTGRPWFSVCLACIMAWLLAQWPTPRKASRQLKLKRDEREMVLTKGEAFRF